jgi:hypothetical protein
MVMVSMIAPPANSTSVRVVQIVFLDDLPAPPVHDFVERAPIRRDGRLQGPVGGVADAEQK